MSDQRNFILLLRARMAEGKSLCIGLDSDISKIPLSFGEDPYERQLAFNKIIINVTHDLVVAYKLNIAFYRDDDGGRNVLKETITYIKLLAPNVPIILDSKRADIGNTNDGYVHEAFSWFGADALTVNPYFGQEALEPFLRQSDKGVIVLCRTSNPGASEFQNRDVIVYEEERAAGVHTGSAGTGQTWAPLYQVIAYNVFNWWNGNGNCMVVVGATSPYELQKVRKIVGDMPILIPGIGAQGGEVLATVKAGMDSKGNGMVINSSRAIIFADDPRQVAIETNNEINEAKEAA